MKQRLRLDFTRLPSFEKSPMIFTLPDDVDVRLRALPSTYQRSQCGLRFSSMIGAGRDVMHVREEEIMPMSAAYLRAALMELVGMEDALGLDVKRLALSGPPISIESDANAMLVVLRELRNLNVHALHSALRREKRAARAPKDGGWFEFEVEVELVDEGDLDQVLKSRGARRHDIGDLTRAVEWLKEAQSHWGIADVVIRGFWEWSRAVVDEHLPVAR